WFHRLDMPAVKGIHPSNRWNMDETGIREGKGSNGLVLGSAASRELDLLSLQNHLLYCCPEVIDVFNVNGLRISALCWEAERASRCV
ncbi:hypothetical protein LZ30DRAFT_606747, partial [Colletotrichum cereale]